MNKLVYRLCYVAAMLIAVTSPSVAVEHIDTLTKTKANLSPYQVVEITAKSLFNRLDKNKDNLTKFPELMETIVQEELLPIIDHRYVAYKVLGKHLNKSTKAQRAKFTQAMKHNIVRSYTAILKQYNGQKLVYAQPKLVKNTKLVSVPMTIVEPSKPPIELVFRLRKHKKTGNWLIFDVLA
ncbi:ABC transporter substrate-binding protein [Thalassotalea euphylliae]|uniref:ABC transporter substrate-binding protein n=1 Tax=Thalassotalea euphylliae TaxID=1655234 RepID=A0A3E0TPP8_9GAMM|nr:ABC transporter substrate-binding protein [Thalassotalea euphylliae]REL26290.1 ABC transporter substrate-binding protein [Thalassotalea euphylliae]